MAFEGRCFILFLFFISIVASEQCITYTFENGFDTQFRNDVIPCKGFAPWTLGDYETQPTVERPHPRSNSFISPSTSPSCTASFLFTVWGAGNLEVHIYMSTDIMTNFVQVMIHNELGQVISTNFFNPSNPNFRIGWNDIRISVPGSIGFNAYISFVGAAQEDHIVLIDSFRYIPAWYEYMRCVIYTKESEEDTQLPESEETELSPELGQCLTHNFELQDFDTQFRYDVVPCTSWFHTWVLGNYNTLPSVERPDPNSNWYISPSINPNTGCTASFLFPIRGPGVLEIHVYMERGNSFDMANFLYARTHNESGRGLGSQSLSPPVPDYQPGWNVLKIPVVEEKLLNIYVSFLGDVQRDSIVLIDSFRYISQDYDEQKCVIYATESEEVHPPLEPDESEEVDTPLDPGEEVDPPTVSNESEYLKPQSGSEESYEEGSSSEPNESKEKYPPPPESEEIGLSPESTDCITYNFEENFETTFTSDVAPCSPANLAWSLGNYDTRPSVESPHPNSNLFISPGTTFSCTSSFLFPVTGSGVLEVNLYMNSEQTVDFVQVLINSKGGGVAGAKFFNPTSPNFQMGWNILRIPVFGLEEFYGFVTFMGSAQESSIILIDSFRYIPTDYDNELCVIYTTKSVELPESNESEGVDKPPGSNESENVDPPHESNESEDVYPPPGSSESHQVDPPFGSNESENVDIPHESNELEDFDPPPGSRESHQVDPPSGSNESENVDPPHESNESKDVDPPPGSSESHQVDPPPGSSESHQVDPPSGSNESENVDLPHESNESEDVDPPPGSNESEVVDPPLGSSESHQVDPPHESNESENVDLPHESNELEDLDPPPGSNEPEVVDPPPGSSESHQVDPPSGSNESENVHPPHESNESEIEDPPHESNESEDVDPPPGSSESYQVDPPSGSNESENVNPPHESNESDDVGPPPGSSESHQVDSPSGSNESENVDPPPGSNESENEDPPHESNESEDVDPPPGSSESYQVDPPSGSNESENVDPPHESNESDDDGPPPGSSESHQIDSPSGSNESDQADPPSISNESENLDPPPESNESEDVDPPAGSKESEYVSTYTPPTLPEGTSRPPVTPDDSEIKDPITNERNYWMLITILLAVLILLITIICCVAFCCFKLGKSNKTSVEPQAIRIINNTGRQVIGAPNVDFNPFLDSNNDRNITLDHNHSNTRPIPQIENPTIISAVEQ